jgi:hypothetical protein
MQTNQLVRKSKQDYQIAIPSYKREKTLIDKTLAMLRRNGIDLRKATVFVADMEEFHIYKNALELGYPEVRVQLGERGIKNIRNFMVKYYFPGERVLFIDDDITELYMKLNDKQLIPVDDLHGFVNQAFDMCIKLKCPIWGIYSVMNPMFMKYNVSQDLKYINACFFGLIIEHDESLFIDIVETKESIERTIKYYLKYGKVLRFNFMAPKTNFYFEPGGQQSQFKDRLAQDTISVKKLHKLYPDLCTLSKNKSRDFLELKLKDRRK